ncbi:unnamed protein product [Aphanomyces euteiches]|uniref:Nuclear control of ATPase protein 2 n=1 Tax=Aphanomyces euteiches TaxID=100861 RepID=A0A6G0XAE1_9STRA|nr:hypothetical protein Ae201684_006752 [Aphanomyces euteiches]KAH9086865.1 hypothetical protein Ae201684P_000282 [Aphanomyces euteiches]KAH9150109.1 hypothetical protein AeRB84_006997 [Aphanomyces euteiches]
MAPTKVAIVQSKIRQELRGLRDRSDLSEDGHRMAAYFLELMHHLAHHDISLPQVLDAHERMESFLAAQTAFKHIAVFEGAIMELTRAVMLVAMHESLRQLLAFGAFVPEALRYWKRQVKKPLELFLLEIPDKVWDPEGGNVPTEEKIRVLEETRELLLIHIGELKLLMLKWPHAEPKRSPDLMQSAQALLTKVFSTQHLIHPRTAAEVDVDDIVKAQPTGSQRFHLKSALEFLKSLPQARSAYKTALDNALSRCGIPRFLRRRWWHLSIGAFGLAMGTVYLARNRRELTQLAFTMHKGIRDFIVDHMIEPITNIVGEVLLNKKALIQDPMALSDSKESLQRMLADFIHDTNPTMPLEEQKALVANMDMSVVSLQYEKELPKAVRNLITGDIVRMMLIQIQFIKKELMVAMKAIDELMDANQLNMQMMATLPMFVAVGGAYYAVKNTSKLIFRFTSSAIYEDPKTVAAQMRYMLRDIERLLNMQNQSPLDNFSINSQPSSGTLSPLLRATGEAGTTLGVRDMGYLVVVLDQLQTLFERNRGYFDEDEQKRFEEDLNDLVGENLLVSQQLAVIARMHHSHAFLVKSVDSKWFH